MATIAPPDAPAPRRTSKPRWLDIRVIGGVLLIVAAVVVGARVIGASSHTSPVWAATRSLAAGTVLTSADLVAVEVNLGTNAGHYLSAGGTAVAGSSLGVAVGAGELVPVSAVAPTKAGKVVVIGVSPDRMPPGVSHGSVIDLYLTSGGASSASSATTVLVSSGIVVQSVVAPASGGLSGATSTTYQIAVLVSAEVADSLVKTLPRGNPIVVLVTGSR